jgi:hypothetical protein
MTEQLEKTQTDDHIKTEGADTADPPAVTLHLRTGPSGPAADRQRAVLTRFETVVEARELSDTTVTRWGRTVATEGAPEAVELYREFRAAVDRAGGRLEPFFERRVREPGLLADRAAAEIVVFPVACLALRRDDAVTGLYPCWLDGVHHSLEAGLDALDGGTAENLG